MRLGKTYALGHSGFGVSPRAGYALAEFVQQNGARVVAHGCGAIILSARNVISEDIDGFR